MSGKKKRYTTELNKNDRKVLDKYTKRYTNFIESGTAGVSLHGKEGHNVKR
ncbi:MAG: hypothetical protein GX992_03750 [Clostridium sp.]|nr:hypothetical protein [Clostridium sp.]